jgi:hypothetical protein
VRAWQKRAAGAGLAALSLLIVCSALAQVPFVVPASRSLQPVTGLIGLEQNWNVFAPRPRRYSLRLEAHVTWSDGRRTVWTIPSEGPLLGAYRDYRWRKWAEHAALSPDAPSLWRPATLYIARRMARRGGAVPRELRLVRYLQPLAVPGSNATHSWVTTELYRAQLGTRSR